MFDNRIDNDFYAGGSHFDYHGDDIEQISFHIASDNSYFIKGIIFSLHKLKQQHSHVNFEHTVLNGSARSALMLTEIIRERKHGSLMVIIASVALLNMLSLSSDHRYMDKVVFIATSECNTAVLVQIADSPNDILVFRDKYFPKGPLAELSDREKCICYYLFRGHTPKIIGAILGINTKTVSSHRLSGMKKIGCTNKSDFYNILSVYYGASVDG